MSIPVYRRVAFDLKQKILSGQYPPGTLLPPEKELQALYQVSRTTVRRAVSQLVEGNYVTVRQGHGTEVTDKHQPMGFHKFHNVTEITERFAPGYDRARTETALFRVDSVPAPPEAAQALEIAPGTTVYRIRRRFHADGMPFARMVNYVRRDVAPGLDGFPTPFDLYSLLSREFHVDFREGCERITACVASAEEAQELCIPEGSPLLQMQRIALSADGPIEYVVTHLRPDVYCLVVSMEGLPTYKR